jgi:hypothetical protein
MGSSLRSTSGKSCELQGADDFRPDVLALAEHDDVRVPGRFFRLDADVQSAHRHLDAAGPEAVGDGVRFEDLGREGADRHEIAVVQLGGLLPVSGRFEIAQVVTGRRRRGEIEQPQARELGDDLAALNDARHRQPQFQQLGVVSAQPAHREKTDLHFTPPCSVAIAATIKAVTGMKNR